MDYLSRKAEHERHEQEVQRRREASEAEDRHFIENGRRERLGLLSLEQEEQQRQIEARNAEVRKRQQQYFEQQQPQSNADDIRLQLQVRDAALAFMANSTYHRSQRNFELLTDYIDQHNLDATKEESFHIAYRALKNQMDKPTRTQERTPEPQPVVDVLPPGAERAPDGRVYTAAEIEAMSSDEFARVFRLTRGHQYKVKTSTMGFRYVDDESQSIGQPR